MYKGYREVTQSELASIYEGKLVPGVNEYVLCEGEAYRFNGETLLPLKYDKIKGFAPKNLEQKMLFDLLSNDKIPIKVAAGIAGSGKTKAAMQYGLNKIKSGEYQRLFIVKQPAPAGEEIGFLKGDKNEKIRNWMGSIVDNLEGGDQELFYLQQRGQIEFDIVAHMLGRDIQDSIIIVDECQLLTKEQIRLLGSRVSKGSCIIFCGDYEQIFNKKYKADNGLVAMIEGLKGHDLFGMVELKESVRSKVAELFSTKLL
jgi:PhoH-like ATPase